jgi:hypothetical protein
MKSYLDILPHELLTHIFEYENPYKKIIKNEIAVEIYKSKWKKWLLKLQLLKNLYMENENRFVEIFANENIRLFNIHLDIEEINIINSNIIFTLVYFLEDLFSSIDLWGFDHYEKNYHMAYPNDCKIHVTHTNKLDNLRMFLVINNLVDRNLFRYTVLTNKQFQIEKKDNIIFRQGPELLNKLYSDNERLLFENRR